MVDFIKRTFTSKTGKAAVGTILATAGAILTDKITGIEGLQLIVPAVLAILVRDRIPKETKRP